MIVLQKHVEPAAQRDTHSTHGKRTWMAAVTKNSTAYRIMHSYFTRQLMLAIPLLGASITQIALDNMHLRRTMPRFDVELKKILQWNGEQGVQGQVKRVRETATMRTPSEGEGDWSLV